MTEPLFYTDAYLSACSAVVLSVEPEGIVLDRTVFYPSGGGQPGDRGELLLADGRVVEIVDTRRGEGGAILHLPAGGAPAVPAGSRVEARIDWRRRYRLMRAHTALHLLSAAVGAPVTGGAVGELEGRLDFDLPDPPERAPIEARLRAWVEADLPVRATWIAASELARRPGLVKTVGVRPPEGSERIRLIAIEGVDVQACGGTHVARTGEIGRIRIVKVEKKGQKNRRIAIAVEPAGEG
ncbi:MAG: alanyl-tRNA editing protein [Geminicoccaceae bacterium]|nr:alanyl-tRNA editing protein [Geminicoccaceae bacterium]